MRNVIWFVAFLFSSNAVLANDSIRCGTELLSDTATVAEFLKKCGEPTTKEITVEDVFGIYHNKTGTTTKEKWTYIRGTRQLPIVVTIVDGEVISVETKIR